MKSIRSNRSTRRTPGRYVGETGRLVIVGLAWVFMVAMNLHHARRVTAEDVAGNLSPPAAWPAEHVEFFEAKIRPVLVEHCYNCHSDVAKSVRGGLRLDYREAIARGGESGSVVDSVHPAESLLVRVLRYGDDVPNMPPDGPLPDDTIADIERWIGMGLPDPRLEPAKTTEPEKSPEETWHSHWAFQPVARPAQVDPSQLADAPAESIRTELDRLIVARQRVAGIVPGEPADPRTLIRRVSYDLIGLPPTADRVEQLVANWSDATYERFVDELLSSPQFGERWARHWLDVMRYADTKGYVFQEDRNLPDAYRYRDWVIRTWNADLPYDQFIQLQLAADQLTATPDDPNRMAMGFLTLGRRFLNNRQDIIDDRIDVVCRGLMGLTVSCARCHDHKYDPIPTADYYSLFGVFASSRTETKESVVMLDVEQPADAAILVRGNPGNQGPVVPRQFLGMLAGTERQPFQRGSGRLEMAEEITDPANPLTPRVLVNRIWGHLFGTFLVDTPSDFGVRSETPAMPEVLDYLAHEFVSSGWSRKYVIRQIVLAHVYRQASDYRAEPQAIDPENRLYWKMNRRRLDFESMRDSLMFAAGRLQLDPIGGPSVNIDQAPFPMRRTLYAFIDRQNLPGIFRTFDMANPDTHAPRRLETVVPQQALFLLNNPFTMEMAEVLAQTGVSLTQPSSGLEVPSDQPVISTRINSMFRAALGRNPSDDELKWATDFIVENMAGETDELGSAETMTSEWQYGYGEFDLSQQQLATFHTFSHWTGKAFQVSTELPDPTHGWVMLDREGGHPGEGLSHVVVRRWIVPFDGVLDVRGRLQHGSADGDGVRGHVALNNRTALWSDAVHNRELETNVNQIDVRQGDVVDLIVDALTNPAHDHFRWPVRMKLRASDGREMRVKSQESFAGPTALPLDPWARLAHVLLLSNEFVILD